MNLVQLLMRTAITFGERPAIFFGDELICNYTGFALRAASISGFLSERLGLKPGDRVAIFMGNGPDYLPILYGAWFGGFVVVPINAKLHPKEAAFIIEDSGSRVLFVSRDMAGSIEPMLASLPSLCATFVPGTSEFSALYTATPLEAPVHRQDGDIAWLFYTSGTTGRPKGVMQTHGNLLAMITCYFIDVDATSPDDTIVYAAPMSHAAGMLNFPHVIKAARHVVPRSEGFDSAELLTLAARYGRVSLFAAPTMIKRLVDYIESSGADATGFGTIVYGGGPMYVEDLRHAQRVIGNRFAQIYGQGESPMTITALSRQHLSDHTHPRYEQRISSVGVAQTLVEVRVAGPKGDTLPLGVDGEVLVRGASVMKGYWNNPDATAKTIREGWLNTGDVGSLDADGFLMLKDRTKDVIISGGSNIYPREIEEVLLLDSRLQEVSVVGGKHPEWGEEVIAFVVIKPGAAVDARELDMLCLQNVARFKRPKQYRFVDALPKSNYGKVLKTLLREQLAAE